MIGTMGTAMMIAVAVTFVVVAGLAVAAVRWIGARLG